MTKKNLKKTRIMKLRKKQSGGWLNRYNLPMQVETLQIPGSQRLIGQHQFE